MLTLQDQEAYLARVREHLEDDGQWVLSLFFPKLHHLVSTDEEEEWFTTQHPDGYEIKVSGIDKYDAIRQIKTETAYRRWTDASGKKMLARRPLFCASITAGDGSLLHYNGFEMSSNMATLTEAL
jgi:hypothetical protein